LRQARDNDCVVVPSWNISWGIKVNPLSVRGIKDVAVEVLGSSTPATIDQDSVSIWQQAGSVSSSLFWNVSFLTLRLVPLLGSNIKVADIIETLSGVSDTSMSTEDIDSSV
jgi:hypothetical protein